MTSSLSSSLSSSSSPSLNRVQDWLRVSPDPELNASLFHPPIPSQPPATAPEQSLKRLRAASPCDTDHGNTPRSSTPTKRWRKDDDPLSEQSASRTGSVVLSDRTNLTATGGAKRTSGPTRQLLELRTARPSISLSSISQPPKQLSEETITRIDRLQKQFSSALRGGYIPGGLKDAIEQDPDFQPSLRVKPIRGEAFDYTYKRTLADCGLADTLREVKRIFQGGTLCAQFGRDENAWSFAVVWPLLELAIKLHAGDRWRLESVQSQSINPLYLSRILDPSAPGKERNLFCTTDFCFSYSYFDPGFRVLYERMEKANAIRLSHTTDNFTSRTVLFSGIEVKFDNGNQNEAELQISIWMAASLRKKMELARNALIETPGSESDYLVTPGFGHDSNDIQNPNINEDDPSITAPLEPAVTIIGHEHRIYYAFPTSATGNISILGPEEDFEKLSTRSVQGIFKLVRFYGTILDYGSRERMSSGNNQKESFGVTIWRNHNEGGQRQSPMRRLKHIGHGLPTDTFRVIKEKLT